MRDWAWDWASGREYGGGAPLLSARCRRRDHVGVARRPPAREEQLGRHSALPARGRGTLGVEHAQCASKIALGAGGRRAVGNASGMRALLAGLAAPVKRRASRRMPRALEACVGGWRRTGCHGCSNHAELDGNTMTVGGLPRRDTPVRLAWRRTVSSACCCRARSPRALQGARRAPPVDVGRLPIASQRRMARAGLRRSAFCGGESDENIATNLLAAPGRASAARAPLIL